MIEKGQTLVNPVTGERLTFVETAENGGERVVIELHADPGGSVAAAHVHPSQWETSAWSPGPWVRRSPAARPSSGPDSFWAWRPASRTPGGTQARTSSFFRCEIRPALQFESLIETMFALAADGKTNAKGMPNPFRLAVIANAYFDTVQLPVIPAWMQKAASSVGALAGKAMGYGPTYVPEPASIEQLVPQAA